MFCGAGQAVGRIWLVGETKRQSCARLVVLGAVFWVTSAHAEQPSPEVLAEDEVQVKGTRAQRDEREPELASSIVAGERLAQPGLELAEALRGEASVQVNQTGGAADLATISIRGASSSQVPVYLAGIRINDDVVGVADLSAVPSFMIHRAVVYQSAPPLHLSRSGMSGALVLEPRLPTRQQGFLKADAGSFSSGAMSAGISVGKDRLWSSLSVRRSGARNDYRYRDDRGTAFVPGDDGWASRGNADFTQTDVWWVSRYLQSGFRVNLIAQGLIREQGVTGLSLLPATQARAALQRGFVGVSTMVACSEAPWSCRLQLSTGLSNTALSTTDPAAELFLTTTDVLQRNQRLSQDLRLTLLSTRGTQVEGSLSFETSRLRTDTVPQLALERRAHEVFATNEWSVSQRFARWLYVRGAGRYQCLRATGSDIGYLEGERPAQVTNSQCLPGARVGVSAEPIGDLHVHSTVLYGARYATLGERYGVSASMRGNPTLAAERGFAADLGAVWAKQSPSLSGSVSSNVFYRSTNDVIAYQRVSLGYVRPFNVELGRFFGADATLALEAASLLRLKLSASYLNAQRIEEGQNVGQIPFRSNLTGQAELTLFRADPWPGVSRVSLGVLGDYRGRRFADPANLVEIPAQATMDLLAQGQFNRQVDLRLRIENLTNAARFDALGYPLPGRGCYLSAELRF